MKRIGILTYFWQDNPGSFLQAYSVLASLKSRFPDDRIEFIDYKYEADRFRLRKRFVNPLRLLEGWRRYWIFRRCQAESFPLSEKGLVTLHYEEAARFIESLGYDLIVVGSDTVLEMRPLHKAACELPIYWLPARLKCLKVGCAISANAMTYGSFNEGMRDRMRESLQAFDLVGVRDDVTYGLAGDLGLEGDPRLERVPDPTFSFDIDYAHIERYLAEKRVDLSGPTLGICLPHYLGRPLARHYRSKGFRIVSLNWAPYADWSPWDMSPLAWAGVYRYFKVMITERFHGTIFSLKSGTPVLTFEIGERRHLTSDGRSKRYTLLDQMGLLERSYVSVERAHDVNEVIRAADAVMESFDCQAVARRVQEMRERFGRYMDQVAGVLA